MLPRARTTAGPSRCPWPARSPACCPSWLAAGRTPSRAIPPGATGPGESGHGWLGPEPGPLQRSAGEPWTPSAWPRTALHRPVWSPQHLDPRWRRYQPPRPGDRAADPAGQPENLTVGRDQDRATNDQPPASDQAPHGPHGLCDPRVHPQRPWVRYGSAESAARSREFGEQLPYPPADLVADRADGTEAEACRIGKVPVEVALAGVDGAGVAAAHGDHHVGGPHLVGRHWLGVLAGDVEADLRHRLDDRGVELVGGL